jgi:hypothetical protein
MSEITKVSTIFEMTITFGTEPQARAFCNNNSKQDIFAIKGIYGSDAIVLIRALTEAHATNAIKLFLKYHEENENELLIFE